MVREGGGSSIPETSVIEPRGRGVLDTRWSLSSGSPKARPGGGYDGYCSRRVPCHISCHRAQVERSQKPRPAGETGRGLGVRSPSRIKMRRRPDHRSGGLSLLDHLNDAAGAPVGPHALVRHPPVTRREDTPRTRSALIYKPPPP